MEGWTVSRQQSLTMTGLLQKSKGLYFHPDIRFSYGMHTKCFRSVKKELLYSWPVMYCVRGEDQCWWRSICSSWTLEITDWCMDQAWNSSHLWWNPCQGRRYSPVRRRVIKHVTAQRDKRTSLIYKITPNIPRKVKVTQREKTGPDFSWPFQTTLRWK